MKVALPVTIVPTRTFSHPSVVHEFNDSDFGDFNQASANFAGTLSEQSQLLGKEGQKYQSTADNQLFSSVEDHEIDMSMVLLDRGVQFHELPFTLEGSEFLLTAQSAVDFDGNSIEPDADELKFLQLDLHQYTKAIFHTQSIHIEASWSAVASVSIVDGPIADRVHQIAHLSGKNGYFLPPSGAGHQEVSKAVGQPIDISFTDAAGRSLELSRGDAPFSRGNNGALLPSLPTGINPDGVSVPGRTAHILDHSKNDASFLGQPMIATKEGDARGTVIAHNKLLELVNRLSPTTNQPFVKTSPVKLKTNVVSFTNQIPLFSAIAPHQIADVIGGTASTISGTNSAKVLLQDGVKMQGNSLSRSLELQLVPRSLGIVHVRIVNSNGHLSIALQTTSVEAEQLLKAEMGQIQEAIKAAGFTADDARISIQYNTNDDGQARQGRFEELQMATDGRDKAHEDPNQTEEFSSGDQEPDWDRSNDKILDDEGIEISTRDGLYF